MRAKNNRLLMFLVGVAISGCASQTDRSSSGGNDQYQPEKESVSIVDRPLAESPPPKPAPVAAAPEPAAPEPAPPVAAASKAAVPNNEPAAEFPITKYELPEEEEEIGDLGPQDDDSISESQDAMEEAESSVGEPEQYAEESEEEDLEDIGQQDDESVSEEQEAATETESSVGEPTQFAEEEDADEIEDIGQQDDESVSEEQEAATEVEGSVGEPTQFAEEEDADEVEDLGPQDDESTSAQQEASSAQESSVGDPTQSAEEEESEVVEDLGPQRDDSGTVAYPEEKRAAAENLVGEPKAYAEETTPKPQAAPATPKVVSINFEAEPLFGFDKSALGADQKAKLDEVIAELRGAEVQSISVVGHADRIGSNSYNQGLSERRANSVKAYLASKGIASNKIQTAGRGKMEPVTGTTCDKERGKKLITCLQPDRRVDVSASGSKRTN